MSSINNYYPGIALMLLAQNTHWRASSHDGQEQWRVAAASLARALLLDGFSFTSRFPVKTTLCKG